MAAKRKLEPGLEELSKRIKTEDFPELKDFPLIIRFACGTDYVEVDSKQLAKYSLLHTMAGSTCSDILIKNVGNMKIIIINSNRRVDFNAVKDAILNNKMVMLYTISWFEYNPKLLTDLYMQKHNKYDTDMVCQTFETIDKLDDNVRNDMYIRLLQYILHYRMVLISNKNIIDLYAKCMFDYYSAGASICNIFRANYLTAQTYIEKWDCLIIFSEFVKDFFKKKRTINYMHSILNEYHQTREIPPLREYNISDILKRYNIDSANMNIDTINGQIILSKPFDDKS